VERRLAEERKWLNLTLAIIAAFTVSVLPVSIFFALSVAGVRSHPAVQLAVWWLLVAGSFLNLAIYTLMNDNMKRSLGHAWRFLAFKAAGGGEWTTGEAVTVETKSKSKAASSGKKT
jgi:hypothetical protein